MTFTSHGHHIVGTDIDFQPILVARCGGPGICSACAKETFQYQIMHPNPYLNQRTPNMITTQKYARKRFEVDAIQITAENMQMVADWCLGEMLQDNGTKFIKVKVVRVLNDRQTKGFVGDWVLHAGGGFKVYTDKAFRASFDVTDDAPRQMQTTSEKLATVATTVHEPSI